MSPIGFVWRKCYVRAFSPLFLIRAFPYLQGTRTYIRAQTSLCFEAYVYEAYVYEAYVLKMYIHIISQVDVYKKKMKCTLNKLDSCPYCYYPIQCKNTTSLGF